MSGCQAMRERDGTIRCALCRLAWDADDDNPPPCGQTQTGVDSESPAPVLEQSATNGDEP